MPKLFPIIDALPNWVNYGLIVIALACNIAGAIWWLWFIWVCTVGLRYEWKQWRMRHREVAIASERMQAAAERWRR